MSEEIKRLLEVATDAAYQAGDLLSGKASELFNINFQDATDVKLQADVDSEKLIREILSKETGFPIIGEEQGGETSLLDQNVPYWVVDPLDGTYNYLRDFPICCVSIGLCSGQTPILGVIHDFNTKTTYSGALKLGCFVDEKLLKPQWAKTVDQAVMLTGFPAARDYSTKALTQFIKDIQAFKKVRMIGSAALALAYVGTGKGDIYFEESVRLWDVAAGAAIVRAAGGHVKMTRVDTKPFAFDIWASGKKEWIPESAAKS
jgi:myo-inositol-1(or 4)-monophosphatase